MAHQPQSSGFFASLLCCCRPRHEIDQECHPRYGAPNISSPNQGAYNSPTQSAPGTFVKVGEPRRSHFPASLTNGHAYDLQEKGSGTSPSASQITKTTNGSPGFPTSQPNSPMGKRSVASIGSIPVHEAFIPGDRYAMQTVNVSHRSPQSSPPVSPPLPTPKSSVSHPGTFETQRRESNQTSTSVSPHIEALERGEKPALRHTISAQQPQTQVQPMRIVPIAKRSADTSSWTPDSAASVEQWPGSY